MSKIVDDGEGDTIFAIDRVSEEILIKFIDREIASHVPIVLIAEGLDGGKVVLPRGSSESEAVWRIIVDPIDGTRGLMYQKRSAWILTGIAPNLGDDTKLSDIEFAIQTEIPLVKQHLSDELWAVRGQGAAAARVNRLTGDRAQLDLHPSGATTLAHGFAMISRFFPGNRTELAAIDDELVAAVLGPPTPGKAQLFEDQYISSGGQMYELMAGHDRFVADLRPLLERRRPGGSALCCHPYDLCTALIAREFGVLVTDERGRALEAPLDVTTDVAWIGYANRSLQALVEPHLRQALASRGLLE